MNTHSIAVCLPAMSVTQQELLKKAWLAGRKGYLSALSEAKRWAVREMWRAEHESDFGLQTVAAEKVTKIGSKMHPTPRGFATLSTTLSMWRGCVELSSPASRSWSPIRAAGWRSREWDPLGIRWGSPRDPLFICGILGSGDPFFMGDPPNEL